MDAGSILATTLTVGNNGVLSFRLKSGLTPDNVGDVATIPVKVSCAHYEDFVVNVKVTLTEKSNASDAITFADGSATYNGSVQTYEAAVISGISGGSFTFSYTTTDGQLEGGKPKDAGTYTVTASYDSATHTGTKTATFIINKAPLTIAFMAPTKKYVEPV